MLEKDIGSAARLGVFEDLEGDDAARSPLTKGASAEPPFDVPLFGVPACLRFGEVICDALLGGLMGSAGLGCEWESGLRGRPLPNDVR